MKQYIFNASRAVKQCRKKIRHWPDKVAGAIRQHLGPKVLANTMLNSRFTVSTEFSGMATAEAGFNIATQMRRKLNCSRCEPVIKSCCDIDRLPQSVLKGTGSCVFRDVIKMCKHNTLKFQKAKSVMKKIRVMRKAKLAKRAFCVLHNKAGNYCWLLMCHIFVVSMSYQHACIHFLYKQYWHIMSELTD